MSTRIYEIIETLKEGQEVTIVLRDGQQMCGLYHGIDGEQLMLESKSGNAPILGWNISDIEDIVSDDNEPAGDVVKAEFVDVKTGRKVTITLDVTEDEGKATIQSTPTAHRDDKGVYLFYANLFIESLSK
ncbi:MAG: hypothetical protein RR971_05585 [Alistipes sp.]